MIKYTTKMLNKIEEVEVARETEKSIFIINNHGKEIRESKRSSWKNYFDTWEETKDFIVSNATSEVNQARQHLERCKEKLGRLKGMKKP